MGCQLMFGWQRSYNPRTTHMEHGITWADLYQVNNSPSVCERDMLKVPGRTKRSDVKNFYLEQPVFTLTCWSLSELGGGCFWQTVAGSDRKSHPPRQDSTDAGFGSTGKLHHSSNIHQTKKALLSNYNILRVQLWDQRECRFCFPSSHPFIPLYRCQIVAHYIMEDDVYPLWLLHKCLIS